MSEEDRQLLSHDDLDEIVVMRGKILENREYLRAFPLMNHLVEVELPRLIATARRGVRPGRE